jgi:hypothetical protein
MLVLLALASAACPELDPGRDPLTREQAQAQCQQLCSMNAATCDDPWKRDACGIYCILMQRCLRGDAMVVLARCGETLACGGPWMPECYASLAPTTAEDRYREACLGAAARCDTTGDFVQTYCADGVGPALILRGVTDAVAEEATACFESPCDLIPLCLMGVSVPCYLGK